MRRCRITVTWIVVLSAASVADADVNGYELLSDWSLIPRTHVGVQAGLASSYDRNWGNGDHSHYESTGSVRQTEDVDPVTVVTLDGPGVITRFWMPHTTADLEFKVKVLLDDVVVIDSTSKELLGGGYGYADGALGSTMLGGQVSYEPIVYSDSQTLKIVSENKASHRHYYQWNYLKLPAGTNVTPYSGTLTPQQTAARGSAISTIANVGSNPAGPSATSTSVPTASQSIGSGQSLVLGNVSGPGSVRAINLKLADATTDAEMDSLRLRVRYDGLSRTAIDVPVSHFFGAGHERAAYQSAPLGASETNEFYSYWPMPYRSGVSVELYNDSAQAVSIDSAAIEYEAGSVADDACYLHAAYNSVGENTDPLYELMLLSGQGHYVGNLLWVDRQDIGTGWGGRSVLEGDDIITVNANSDNPTVLPGTGLEDAYNGGYYYNHVGVHPGEEARPYSGAGPYHGLLRANIPTSTNPWDYSHTDQYRWLIPDPVPFTDGIKVEMEQYNRTYGASFGSVAFYYLMQLFGDANDDMRVDLDDFVILRDSFGKSGQGLAADFDEDGDVDMDDFETFQSTFGRLVWSDVPAAAPEPDVLSDNMAVPEPMSLTLLAIAGLSVVRRRRNR